ncbi:hypothetical protein AVEN_150977-1, partial [Araneus ventricosus]
QPTTEPTLEQSPTKNGLWRTTDNRPVCFHCGRSGHVVRYCPDRRAIFKTYRRNQGRESYRRPHHRGGQPTNHQIPIAASK